jgi:Contractile injection system tape measure protein
MSNSPTPLVTIEQVTIELQTNSIPVGKTLSERISRLFYSDLQQVLMEELTHYAPHDVTLYLPSLALELEPVSADRVEQNMPDYLRQALHKAFAEPSLLMSLTAEPPLPNPSSTYIANAGLVLLWPFLTMLFDRVGYLHEKAFTGPEAAARAAHLLQFLVTGEENPPEHLLVLNKLLCGIERPQTLERILPLTPEEKATGEGMLGAALGQWEALKNTSIAGLRETFLQRSGKLVWSPDKVTLTVETKTLDILLDQLPWSVALIKLPWMALPLYVTWR